MFEELVDAGGVVFGVIQGEVKIGNAAELQAFEDFVANKTDSVLESFEGAFLLFFCAARADEDAGIAAVGSEADLVDDHGNFKARIF